jgi:saccharopine dehydrogenase-like NADP-dependent oxidoreductase
MNLHNLSVAVYGAYGHTGKFVVAELLSRGVRPIICGRDSGKLAQLNDCYSGLETRVADIHEASALNQMMRGVGVIIHCAGPFLDSAALMIEAAMRSGAHYLDVCAEQAATRATFANYSALAQAHGLIIVPSMAFFGGLGDLLATAAMDDWESADSIELAVALDSWHPTLGTRLTGQRNTVPRVVWSGSQLIPLSNPAPTREWEFPDPFGTQAMLALPLAEIITIAQHLHVKEIQSYMNLQPLHDLRDAQTPGPQASDDSGRSAQQFMLEVRVNKNGQQRRAVAHGRDIYAISAPLVVEAALRLIQSPRDAGGVFAAGALFDAKEFLAALTPKHLHIRYQ